jgi:hypothetical protein
MGTRGAKASPTDWDAFRRLYRLYEARRPSVWNSYALICTSAAARARNLRPLKIQRCGHEIQRQNGSYAAQPEQVAIFWGRLPCLAPDSGTLSEGRRICSDLSLGSLELRWAMRQIQFGQFDPTHLLTYLLSRLVESHSVAQVERKSGDDTIDAEQAQLPRSPTRAAGEVLKTAARRWPSRYY